MLQDEDDGMDDLDLPDDDNAEEYEDTHRCPECGRSFHYETDHCPYCGHWVSEEEPRPATGFRAIWTIAAVLVMLAMLWGILTFFRFF